MRLAPEGDKSMANAGKLSRQEKPGRFLNSAEGAICLFQHITVIEKGAGKSGLADCG